MLPSMGGCAGVWARESASPPASVTATPRRTTRRSTRATLLQTRGRRQRRGQASVPPLHFLPRPLRPDVQGGLEMSESKQLFSANLAKDAVYKTGLRSFMEYRDLGIEKATHGQFRAHVIRIKKESAGHHELHTTGLHQHKCDFQMFYVLNGWIKFVYEGHGEHTFGKGDCILQPPGIVHNELDCSDDLEVLEVYSPAVHETVVVGRIPEAAAAAR